MSRKKYYWFQGKERSAKEIARMVGKDHSSIHRCHRKGIPFDGFKKGGSPELFFEFKGKVRTLNEISDIIGVSKKVISVRLHRGDKPTPEEAFRPLTKRKKIEKKGARSDFVSPAWGYV